MNESLASPWRRSVLYLAVLAAAVAAVVIIAPSISRAAAPVFLTSDNAPEAAAVTLLAAGENQVLVGPPVRAHDADGDTLRYSLSGQDAGSFTIDSRTGQISRRTSTMAGVYQVQVRAADASVTASVNVTIHITSPGQATQNAWTPVFWATTSDGSANDRVGQAVDATAEIIVTSGQYADGSNVSDVGAVYVFDASNGRQLARLGSPNPVRAGAFGLGLAVAGDTIFVGAPGEQNSSDLGAGRVHVFEKPSGGWVSTSAPDATLTSSPGELNYFGWRVSASNDGNTLAVGAPGYGEHPLDPESTRSGAGAVFVFTKPSGGWADANTDAAATLLARGSWELGKSVAISGDGNTIAASSPFEDSERGRIHIFERPSRGWANTTSSKTLVASDRYPTLRLGSQTLAFSDDGSTLVATGNGRWNKDYPSYHADTPADHSGAAYVFERPGSRWSQNAAETAKLSSFGHQYDLFGFGVAISGDGQTIAVSNHNSRSSNFRGSVYVFTRPAGRWATDTDGRGANVRVLTAADADTKANQRYGFGGQGLAFIGNDRLAVGQIAYSKTLADKDGMNSLPAGGLYGANEDQSRWSNIRQGSVHLFRMQAGFTDVSADSVHFESIATVARLGITRGTTATTFSPGLPVTRGQMGSFLARLWTVTDRFCPTSGAASFGDVPASSTHVDNIDCISVLGITQGTTATTYSPNKSVARGQMASFLARFWRATGRSCPTSGALSFSDVSESSTHADNIDCMSALGITRGTTATTFSPGLPVTRGQMASFLARFHQALTSS